MTLLVAQVCNLCEMNRLKTCSTHRRNFTIAGWMIRKHLDYTSTFAFQARTGMPEVDEQMESPAAHGMLP